MQPRNGQTWLVLLNGVKQKILFLQIGNSMEFVTAIVWVYGAPLKRGTHKWGTLAAASNLGYLFRTPAGVWYGKGGTVTLLRKVRAP